MNKIKLSDNIAGIPEQNIFKFRKDTYEYLVGYLKHHLDVMYSEAEEVKKRKIDGRHVRRDFISPSLTKFYKGIEFPIFDKTTMVINGNEYIPVIQMVDKPIHSQRNGQFIIVKTNLRNGFLKLDGTSGIVLHRTGKVPLLYYLMILGSNMEELLNICFHDLERTDNESDAAYFIPNFYALNENNEVDVYMYKPCRPGHWKHYTLSVFSKEKIAEHARYVKDVFEEGGWDTVEELMLNMLIKYHGSTSRKHSISKSYLTSLIDKIKTKDMSMSGYSVYDILVDSISNDNEVPTSVDIGDINYKILRYMEWLIMKLISVRSYPEKEMIMEIAKVEERMLYNDTLNPLAELGLMTKCNLFGKGGLPRESCQSAIRNLHDSYKGVVDPIDSPSGDSIGISLHLNPEVGDPILSREILRLRNSHIFVDNEEVVEV